MSKNKIFVPYLTKSSTINIAIDTIKKNKQALVFVSSKKSAEKQAADIAKYVETNAFTERYSEKLADLSDKIEHALESPTIQCKKLANCVKKGVAFHHSGLTSKQRDLIEEAFRNNLIKIICSTPTLAAGLDLPAFRTILNSLKRFSNYGMNYIPVMEYKQMAGRAGRPGKEDRGEAIIIAKEENKDELVKKFIFGEVEEITSKLAVEPVLRTHILSLIATGIVKNKKELLEFFDETFWAYQFKDKAYLHNIIQRMLDLIESFEFIKFTNKKREGNKITPDFKSAFDLSTSESESDFEVTLLGSKVSKLYLDPVSANFLIETFEKLENLKKKAKENQISDIDFSILQMISSTLEIRPYFRTSNKEWNYIQEKLIDLKESLVVEEPQIYEDRYEFFFDQIKTALVLMDWINEIDEQTILEKHNIRPGEIRAKIQIADWLLYSATELAKITKHLNLVSDFTKMRIRIINGVREELLPLLKLKGIGRIRARKLFNLGIKRPFDFKKADFNIVKKTIGEKTTIKILEQINKEYDLNLTVNYSEQKVETNKKTNNQNNKNLKKKNLLNYF